MHGLCTVEIVKMQIFSTVLWKAVEFFYLNSQKSPKYKGFPCGESCGMCGKLMLIKQFVRVRKTHYVNVFCQNFHRYYGNRMDFSVMKNWNLSHTNCRGRRPRRPVENGIFLNFPKNNNCWLPAAMWFCLQNHRGVEVAAPYNYGTINWNLNVAK